MSLFARLPNPSLESRLRTAGFASPGIIEIVDLWLQEGDAGGTDVGIQARRMELVDAPDDDGDDSLTGTIRA